MSMHKVPLTPTEEAGLRAHGLQRGIGAPSQLADVFRQGVAWGMAAERERLERAEAAAKASAPEQHPPRAWLQKFRAWRERTGFFMDGRDGGM